MVSSQETWFVRIQCFSLTFAVLCFLKVFKLGILVIMMSVQGYYTLHFRFSVYLVKGHIQNFRRYFM